MTTTRTLTPTRGSAPVFLGLDHRFFGDGPPLLFETMRFTTTPAGRRQSDDYQERYATWDEAVAGHARALAEVLAREAGR